MGCVRGEEHVGRHHIRWNIDRHRDIYSQLRHDIKLHRLGGYFLHPWIATVYLVRRVPYILRRLSGGAEVHNGGRAIAHRELVWPSPAHILENESPMEKYIYVGTVSGLGRYQYLGQFLLVLPPHRIAALHEQDFAI